MPTMQRNSKGHFVKRKSGGGGRRRKSASRALVRQSTRTVYRTPRAAPRRRRSSRGGGGGGVNLLHVGLAAAGLAYVAGESGPSMVREFAAKIPGTKTFGAAATIGLGCLAIDRFVKPNRYLKLAGIAGVVLAATQIGKQGAGFKWVGDDEMSDVEDVADLDVSDVEDVGDEDDY